jgi:transcriptional regulator of arginine metabolism
VVSALLVKVESTGPLIVIRTATGGAPAVAAALDQAGWKEIIGTLAGDDTLLVITRNSRGRRAVELRLASLAQ